ncbi:indoleacetamide hydrolase [Haliea sp.]
MRRPLQFLASLILPLAMTSHTLPAYGGDIARQLGALRAGTLSSEELVMRSFTLHERYREHNIFINLPQQAVLQEARERDRERTQGRLRGPLHGIPLVVKDNIHVAGMPNTAGTEALRAFVPEQDADVVARLRAAGAIILGKTNMHELAYGITSDNRAYGAVGNAVDPKYFAGGSSGGTAVAVALDLAAAGLGTDTGGSSRIPAALNGIVGFRPTTGRYPNAGLVMISRTRDTVGPMAKSVEDIIVLDQVLAEKSYTRSPVTIDTLRIGVPRDYFYTDLDPAVARRMARILQALADAGVTLVEEPLPMLADLNEKIGFPLVIHETKKLLVDYLAENLPELSLSELVAEIRSPDVQAVMDMVVSGTISEATYRAARDIYRPALQQVYRDYFLQTGVDAILFPTVPLPARPIAGSMESVTLNGTQVPTFPTYIRNTDPASNAGIPGLTLPAGTSEQGLPLGIELDGPERSDERLLAIGLALERFLANM